MKTTTNKNKGNIKHGNNDTTTRVLEKLNCSHFLIILFSIFQFKLVLASLLVLEVLCIQL